MAKTEDSPKPSKEQIDAFRREREQQKGYQEQKIRDLPDKNKDLVGHLTGRVLAGMHVASYARVARNAAMAHARHSTIVNRAAEEMDAISQEVPKLKRTASKQEHIARTIEQGIALNKKGATNEERQKHAEISAVALSHAQKLLKYHEKKAKEANEEHAKRIKFHAEVRKDLIHASGQHRKHTAKQKGLNAKYNELADKASEEADRIGETSPETLKALGLVKEEVASHHATFVLPAEQHLKRTRALVKDASIGVLRHERLAQQQSERAYLHAGAVKTLATGDYQAHGTSKLVGFFNEEASRQRKGADEASLKHEEAKKTYTTEREKLENIKKTSTWPGHWYQPKHFHEVFKENNPEETVINKTTTAGALSTGKTKEETEAYKKEQQTTVREQSHRELLAHLKGNLHLKGNKPKGNLAPASVVNTHMLPDTLKDITHSELKNAALFITKQRIKGVPSEEDTKTFLSSAKDPMRAYKHLALLSGVPDFKAFFSPLSPKKDAQKEEPKKKAQAVEGDVTKQQFLTSITKHMPYFKSDAPHPEKHKRLNKVISAHISTLGITDPEARALAHAEFKKVAMANKVLQPSIKQGQVRTPSVGRSMFESITQYLANKVNAYLIEDKTPQEEAAERKEAYMVNERAKLHTAKLKELIRGQFNKAMHPTTVRGVFGEKPMKNIHDSVLSQKGKEIVINPHDFPSSAIRGASLITPVYHAAAKFLREYNPLTRSKLGYGSTASTEKSTASGFGGVQLGVSVPSVEGSAIAGLRSSSDPAAAALIKKKAEEIKVSGVPTAIAARVAPLKDKGDDRMALAAAKESLLAAGHAVAGTVIHHDPRATPTTPGAKAHELLLMGPGKIAHAIYGNLASAGSREEEGHRGAAQLLMDDKIAQHKKANPLASVGELTSFENTTRASYFDLPKEKKHINFDTDELEHPPAKHLKETHGLAISRVQRDFAEDLAASIHRKAADAVYRTVYGPNEHERHADTLNHYDDSLSPHTGVGERTKSHKTDFLHDKYVKDEFEHLEPEQLKGHVEKSLADTSAKIEATKTKLESPHLTPEEKAAHIYHLGALFTKRDIHEKINKDPEAQKHVLKHIASRKKRTVPVTKV